MVENVEDHSSVGLGGRKVAFLLSRTHQTVVTQKTGAARPSGRYHQRRLLVVSVRLHGVVEDRSFTFQCWGRDPGHQHVLCLGATPQPGLFLVSLSGGRRCP